MRVPAGDSHTYHRGDRGAPAGDGPANHRGVRCAPAIDSSRGWLVLVVMFILLTRSALQVPGQRTGPPSARCLAATRAPRPGRDGRGHHLLAAAATGAVARLASTADGARSALTRATQSAAPWTRRVVVTLRESGCSAPPCYLAVTDARGTWFVHEIGKCEGAEGERAGIGTIALHAVGQQLVWQYEHYAGGDDHVMNERGTVRCRAAVSGSSGPSCTSDVVDRRRARRGVDEAQAGLVGRDLGIVGIGAQRERGVALAAQRALGGDGGGRADGELGEPGEVVEAGERLRAARGGGGDEPDVVARGVDVEVPGDGRVRQAGGAAGAGEDRAGEPGRAVARETEVHGRCAGRHVRDAEGAVVAGGEPVTVPHAVVSRHAMNDFDRFSIPGIRSP